MIVMKVSTTSNSGITETQYLTLVSCHAVYEDDTTIIPRSTTVVAKRLPAAKSGRGGAARYVSGKIPMNAKNTHRSENISSKPSSSGRMAVTSNNTMNVLELHTEEERMAAVLKMGADQWEQQQQEMAKWVSV